MIRCFILVLFSFSVHAASFEKYAPKLLKFEGAGYGIHKPLWGDKVFSKQEALNIYRKEYWNKYHGNRFKSQELAEVLIDHLINAGEGRDFMNIKAFQAIIGVEQTGKLSLADVRKANEYPYPAELVNSFVKYRVLYYRSRKLAHKYPGWEKRARSFFINTDENELLVSDYLLPVDLEEKFGHIALAD
jgi:lysozyme family protein